MSELWKLGIMFLIALILGYSGVILSFLLVPKRPNKEKLEPYESGVKPGKWPKGRLAVRYFLVALIFLIFDVEAILLFPWALHVGDFKILAAFEGGFFILVLLVGYVYAWGKGALRWL